MKYRQRKCLACPFDVYFTVENACSYEVEQAGPVVLVWCRKPRRNIIQDWSSSIIVYATVTRNWQEG